MVEVEVYEAIPFNPFARPAVVNRICRAMARLENLFTDYERACNPVCNDVMQCPRCHSRMTKIHLTLTDPKARVWEVWKDGCEIVGILYLTNIAPGCDAEAHYVFFDDNLSGKKEVLEQMIQWCFSEHDGWPALKRLTVTVPDYAHALAHHAARHLGFGGDFVYECKKQWKRKDKREGKGGWVNKSRTIRIPVEGVKKSAIRWNGRDCDVLILGRRNG